MTLFPLHQARQKELAMTREDFVIRWRTRLSEWTASAHLLMERESRSRASGFRGGDTG